MVCLTAQHNPFVIKINCFLQPTFTLGHHLALNQHSLLNVSVWRGPINNLNQTHLNCIIKHDHKTKV